MGVGVGESVSKSKSESWSMSLSGGRRNGVTVGELRFRVGELESELESKSWRVVDRI